MRIFLSPTRRFSRLSVSRTPLRTSDCSARAGLTFSKSRSRSTSGQLPPWAKTASRTSCSCADFPAAAYALSRSKPAQSVYTDSIWYQSPAGSIACTASYTVQKYRSRSQTAKRIISGESTGDASSTEAMLFSRIPGCAIPRDRTIPSVRRLPPPNGTTTRTPGTTLSASAGGMR